MTKLSSFVVLFLLAATSTIQAQIDRTWLTVDTTAKTATFQLTAGLTQLNGGLNFNRFANHDANLPHSAEVVDTTKPMPVGPVEPPAFPRAMTVQARLLQGLGSGETDSVRFVANRAGSYMIFCAVPGHGLAGMWIRLTVSPTEKRPTLTSSSS